MYVCDKYEFFDVSWVKDPPDRMARINVTRFDRIVWLVRDRVLRVIDRLRLWVARW